MLLGSCRCNLFMNKILLKNIWAVVAGFLVIIILSVATDFILEKFVVTINLVLALIYRSIYTIVGGFITAKLSATNPMRQVYISAAIGLALGTLGAVANWDKAVGSEWYPVLVAVTGPIFVWIGGKIYLRK